MRASIPDHSLYSWESQACQYPESGPPGVSYFYGELDDGRYVDCLLYRHSNGALIGILNHYPFDFPPLEQKGNVNIWVRGDHQRQGIGRALLTEAHKRWGPFDKEQQRYTEAGLAFVNRLLTTEAD